METESGLEVTCSWGFGGNGGYRSMSRVSIWDDEKVLEMDSSDAQYYQCT